MADKHNKQYYNNKPTEVKWMILNMDVARMDPYLFLIKCDDSDTPFSPSEGFVQIFSSVRLETSSLILDSDDVWVELTLDNIVDYDSTEVTNLATLFGALTGATF
jgi:hypothetical protein